MVQLIESFGKAFRGSVYTAPLQPLSRFGTESALVEALATKVNGMPKIGTWDIDKAALSRVR